MDYNPWFDPLLLNLPGVVPLNSIHFLFLSSTAVIDQLAPFSGQADAM